MGIAATGGDGLDVLAEMGQDVSTSWTRLARIAYEVEDRLDRPRGWRRATGRLGLVPNLPRRARGAKEDE
jgi:hypothetical protein